VPSQHRTKAHREIQELATIDIRHPGTLGRCNADRIRIPVLERRRYSHRNRLLGDNALGARGSRLCGEALPFGLHQLGNKLTINRTVGLRGLAERL